MYRKYPEPRDHLKNQSMENRPGTGWKSKLQKSADRLIDLQYWTYPTSSSNTEKNLILRKKATRDFIFGIAFFIILLISMIIYIIYPKYDMGYLIANLLLVTLVVKYMVEVYYMLTSKIPYMVRIGGSDQINSVIFYEKKGVVFYFEIILILVFCSITLAFVFWSISFLR